MHRQEKKIPKALRRLALGVALLGLLGPALLSRGAALEERTGSA